MKTVQLAKALGVLLAVNGLIGVVFIATHDASPDMSKMSPRVRRTVEEVEAEYVMNKGNLSLFREKTSESDGDISSDNSKDHSSTGSV